MSSYSEKYASLFTGDVILDLLNLLPSILDKIIKIIYAQLLLIIRYDMTEVVSIIPTLFLEKGGLKLIAL